MCCCSASATAGAPGRPSYDHPPGTSAVDPIVQALALTDVVVNATVSALLLDLALQVHTRHGTLHPQAIEPLDGKKR